MGFKAQNPLLFSKQYYARATKFMYDEHFDSANLQKSNHRNVTPLTLAVEQGLLSVVQELLALGANPVFVNPHGYAPLHLTLDQELQSVIKEAVRAHTCAEINCAVGEKFKHNGKLYTVTRVIRGGSNSIKVFEVENLLSGERLILKVKPAISGLELRNYILLNKYVDIFPIKRFVLDGCEYLKVTGLMQRLVPGEKLGLALSKEHDLAKRDQMIHEAIVALCKLHKQHLVHFDPLPNNCLWDEATGIVEFIDYDIMRTRSEMRSDQFSRAVIYDFRRLLLGCITRTGSQIKGLNSYTDNMTQIINGISNTYMDPAMKSRIHTELARGLGSKAQSRPGHNQLRIG